MNEKGDQFPVDSILKNLILYVGDKTSKGGPIIIDWRDHATFGAKEPPELHTIIKYAVDNKLLKGHVGQQSQLRLDVDGMRIYEELKRPEEPRGKIGFHHQ